MYHIPVLLGQSVDLLDINPDGVYVDLTLGGGGHSREILSRLSSRGRLFSFDQDADAIANAPNDKRLTTIHNNFRFVHSCVKACGVNSVDGILADLGVSSHHFDTPDRGFSFRFEAEKLDMRMNQSAPLTAADVLNNYEIEALAVILGRYGEIENPFRVAKAIAAAKPLVTVADLKDAVARCTPKAGAEKFYAKLFQALRIEVNGEMAALEMMLSGAKELLATGGTMSVISYHSLEDRLVKNFLKSGNFEGEIQTDFYGKRLSPFEVITRKAIEPSEKEKGENPRSRSAKLRAAKKI